MLGSSTTSVQTSGPPSVVHTSAPLQYEVMVTHKNRHSASASHRGTHRVLGLVKVVRVLQIHPELRGCLEELCESQSRIGGDVMRY